MYEKKNGSRIRATCRVDRNAAAGLKISIFALRWPPVYSSGNSKTGGEHRFSAKHIHGIEPAAETMPDPFDFFPVLSSSFRWRGLFRLQRQQYLRAGCREWSDQMEIQAGGRGARFSRH